MNKKIDIKSLYNLDDKDLDKLSNEEILEIMSNLNEEQLKKIGTMSIYDSFYGVLECKEMMNEFKVIERIGSKEEKEAIEKN